ncbi:hypothetical protein CEXT_139271 [Caerostris extrusa]|uniref:Uncharacterized protein n=1 Tax=Caerostris extrusa TaxID=172846 RepID=A0AAV4XSJ3_CAEEX|nr:hypothetical protein CEXT_139271 [Caerostris extrusa]
MNHLLAVYQLIPRSNDGNKPQPKSPSPTTVNSVESSKSRTTFTDKQPQHKTYRLVNVLQISFQLPFALLTRTASRSYTHSSPSNRYWFSSNTAVEF